MKINWGEVAKSTGYQSMKAAVATASHRFSYDDRYEKAFAFAIGRAKQRIYIICWLKDQDYTDYLIAQLNTWELDRKQSFLSYYTNYNLPKKSSRILKTPGIRSRVKYYKNDSWYKNSHIATEEVTQHLQKIRTKKARWTPEYKARINRFR